MVTFLPIVARELRVASRRRATYWVRSAAALSVILVGVVVFLSGSGVPPESLSMMLFTSLAAIAGIYCLFSGVRATSDCLSEEKREGTLGLLFLTDLKGYDVVLGKLAGTSLNTFYGLLAVVPLLAVPLLLGGVTLSEFQRMGGVVLNTLWFSLTVGLFVSASSQSSRAASGGTFLLLISFAAFLPGVGAILSYALKKPHLQTLFLVPSPVFTFFTAYASAYKSDPKLFWWSMATIHGLGWLFFVTSAFIVPRSWQDKPKGATRARWRERWQLWSYGNSAERLAFRTRLLDTNAFYWLAARARLKPALVWAALGLVASGWLLGLAKFRHDWLDTALYFCTGLVLNMLVKVWFVSEAGRQFVEERKQGSLELMLSTSLTVPEILRGQRLALQRQFLGPLIATLTVFILLMIATADNLKTEPDVTFWIMVWLAGIVMILADLAALYWVGIWQALISKHPNRAASGTAARILIFPWLGFLLVSLLLPTLGGRRIQNAANFLLALWFILGLVADVVFGGVARYKLLSEFRQVAAQRISHKPSWLKRLFWKTPNSSSVQLKPARTEG